MCEFSEIMVFALHVVAWHMTNLAWIYRCSYRSHLLTEFAQLTCLFLTFLAGLMQQAPTISYIMLDLRLTWNIPNISHVSFRLWLFEVDVYVRYDVYYIISCEIYLYTEIMSYGCMAC